MQETIKALTELDISEAICGGLSHWTLTDKALQRVIDCKTYYQALDLLHDIGCHAEKTDHHPDLLLHYKKLTIRYWTHTAQGVTELDLEQAKQVEALIQDKCGN